MQIGRITDKLCYHRNAEFCYLVIMAKTTRHEEKTGQMKKKKKSAGLGASVP